MKIDFLHMWVKDFKSFLGEHQLYLGPGSRGLWFVRGRNRLAKRLGSNGAGKSSLWDALVWCLYGVTPGGLRNPDVRPWQGAPGPTEVAVLVQVGGKRRTIARTTSPNRLTINGKDADNAAVVKLIGMPFEVLTNTIVLGQGGKLFFDLTPGEKMDMLSEVKQLDRWDGRSVQAGAQVRKLEAEIATVEGELYGLEGGLGMLKNSVEDAERSSRQWTKKNAKAQEAAAKVVKGHQKKLTVLDNELATLDLKYDGAMTEVRACERQISQLGLDVSNTKAQLTQRRLGRAGCKATIDTIRANLKKLKEAKRCPTCGNIVRAGDLREHQGELRKELHNWKTKLRKLKVRAIKTALETAESNLAHAQKYLEGFHVKADSAQRDLKAKQEVAAKLREELRTAKAAQEENPYTQLLREAQQRIRVMDKDIADAKKDKVKFEKELARAQGWVKGFKDIKLHIIEEFLQELEITTAGMLEEVGLVGWTVKYLIERELKSGKTKRGLTILIGSPESKGLVKWESWSGGEGQRLRVVGALSLATVLLNHAGVEPNMEVLDEPTQHMSQEGVDDLCEFLADRARSTGRRIFYADQQSVESARFAGVVTVRKTKAGSRIGVKHG